MTDRRERYAYNRSTSERKRRFREERGRENHQETEKPEDSKEAGAESPRKSCSRSKSKSRSHSRAAESCLTPSNIGNVPPTGDTSELPPMTTGAANPEENEIWKRAGRSLSNTVTQGNLDSLPAPQVSAGSVHSVRSLKTASSKSSSRSSSSSPPPRRSPSSSRSASPAEKVPRLSPNFDPLSLYSPFTFPTKIIYCSYSCSL